jgi:hypothetical protein
MDPLTNDTYTSMNQNFLPISRHLLKNLIYNKLAKITSFLVSRKGLKLKVYKNKQ